MDDRKPRRRVLGNQATESGGDEKMAYSDSQRKSHGTTKTSNNTSLTTKLITLLILILVLSQIIWIAVPLIFRASPTLQGHIVFLNYASIHSLFYNMSKPEQFGLNCSISFRIQSDNGIKIGAWYIPPNEKRCEPPPPNSIDDLHMNDGRLVVLYAHGNAGTRGSVHRNQLYHELSNHLGVHVVTFDYRGYGDSTNVFPTTDGVVNDTRNVYRWILGKNVPNDRIILWGHSLGTAIVSRLANELSPDEYPLGIVLEAPFTDMDEATENFPLSALFRFLPYFRYTFIEPLITNPNTNFNTTAMMSNIRCPILILHAKDDKIIPYKIGEKLHQQAVKLQPSNVENRAQLISYPGELGYGHKKIYLDPGLPAALKKFFDSLQQNIRK